VHIPAPSASPAVVHQVDQNLVQDFLQERSADPQVLQGLRRYVGQLGLPAPLVTQGGAVVLAAEQNHESIKRIYTKIMCLCEFEHVRYETIQNSE